MACFSDRQLALKPKSKKELRTEEEIFPSEEFK